MKGKKDWDESDSLRGEETVLKMKQKQIEKKFNSIKHLSLLLTTFFIHRPKHLISYNISS